MASLFRKGKNKKIPNGPNPANEPAEIVNNHQQKLVEGCDEDKRLELEDGGVMFYLKYLGFTLVDEVSEDDSYANGASEKAVQRILRMAGQKPQKVELWVTKDGINMKDCMTQEVLLDVSIFRISFCTVCKVVNKVFAFIARNTINETMECHAFECGNKKNAQDVALTVGQSFSEAKEKSMEEEECRFFNNKTTCSTSKKQKSQISPRSADQCASDQQNVSLRLPPPSPFKESSTNGRASLTPPGKGVKDTHNTSAGSNGSDEENREVEDFFSQLAETRSRDQVPPFGTNFIDGNSSMWPNVSGQDFLKESPSEPSVDDLLCL